MNIESLELRNFRSHESFTATFDKDVSVIVGENGSGKTNILESLYVLTHGASFRDNDKELIMHSQDWWQVKAIVDGVHREVRYTQYKKTAIIDDTTYQRLTQSTKLPVVLFEPDDLYVVHAGPTARRELVDRYLDRVSPQFRSAKKQYDRGLRQRNRLLKQPRVDEDSLFTWDVLLARYGTVLRYQREALIRQYNEVLSPSYSHIANEEAQIRVEYVSNLPTNNYEQQLLTQLKARTDTDRLRGYTSVGPHRDDIQFYLNDQAMATNASRGEIRSLLLALKQYEAQSEERLFGSKPLILLDDVFSELDTKRQSQLLSLFKGHQVVITATEVPMTHSGHIIEIQKNH